MFKMIDCAFVVLFGVAGLNLTCAPFYSRDHSDEAENQRAVRRTLCEEGNRQCALGCGTPEYIDRRVNKDATREFPAAYSKCTAVCGDRYQDCLRRVDSFGQHDD